MNLEREVLNYENLRESVCIKMSLRDPSRIENGGICREVDLVNDDDLGVSFLSYVLVTSACPFNRVLCCTCS